MIKRDQQSQQQNSSAEARPEGSGIAAQDVSSENAEDNQEMNENQQKAQ